MCVCMYACIYEACMQMEIHRKQIEYMYVDWQHVCEDDTVSLLPCTACSYFQASNVQGAKSLFDVKPFTAYFRIHFVSFHTVQTKQNNMKNNPSTILCRDSNLQHFDHNHQTMPPSHYSQEISIGELVRVLTSTTES